MRLAIATAFSTILLAACGGEAPKPVEPTPPVETPAPVEPAPAPAADARIGTMNLSCGGETFSVAFLDTHAAIVSADRSTTTELAKQEPGPSSEPGVTLYTDGMQSFAISGGGDTPTLIRYAKGKMAWQDCAIAVN